MDDVRCCKAADLVLDQVDQLSMQLGAGGVGLIQHSDIGVDGLSLHRVRHTAGFGGGGGTDSGEQTGSVAGTRGSRVLTVQQFAGSLAQQRLPQHACRFAAVQLQHIAQVCNR